MTELAYSIAGGSVNELDIGGEFDDKPPKTLGIIVTDDASGIVFIDQFGKYATIDVGSGTIGNWASLDPGVSEEDAQDLLGKPYGCSANTGQAIVVWPVRDSIGGDITIKASVATGGALGGGIVVGTITGGRDIDAVSVAVCIQPPIFDGGTMEQGYIAFAGAGNIQLAPFTLSGGSLTILGVVDSGYGGVWLDAIGLTSDSSVIISRSLFSVAGFKVDWGDATPIVNSSIILGGDGDFAGMRGVARLHASLLAVVGGSPDGSITPFSSIKSVTVGAAPVSTSGYKFNNELASHSAVCEVDIGTIALIDYTADTALIHMAGVNSGAVKVYGSAGIGGFAVPPLFASMDIAPTLRPPLSEEFDKPVARLVAGYISHPTDDGLYEEFPDATHNFAFGQNGWSGAPFIFRTHVNSIGSAPDRTGTMFFSEENGDELIITFGSPVSFDQVYVTAGSTGGIASMGDLQIFFEYEDGGWQVYGGRSDLFAGSGYYTHSWGLKPLGRSYDEVEGWTETPVSVRLRMVNSLKSAFIQIRFIGLKIFYPPAHYLILKTVDVQMPELKAQLYRGAAGQLGVVGELSGDYVNYGAMLSYEDQVTFGDNYGSIENMAGDGGTRGQGGGHPASEVYRLASPSMPD